LVRFLDRGPGTVRPAGSAPMDFQVKALGPCRKKVAVTIPQARVREEYDKQYDEINKNFALPGFRKGKAPRKLLEKRFGEKLGDEVKENLVKAALEKLVEDKKVEPLAPPTIPIESLAVDPAKALEFEFELVTRPEFETPKYKGVEVKVPALSVPAEEVDRAVDEIRRRGATLKTAEGAAVADGDVLVVDWKASSGDSVEAHDENVFYPFGRGVLAGFVAAGLDDQLRKKKVGATAAVKVTGTADDPREELRGKELDLRVELKEVKRYELPEVDAAFLKKHDYDDVAEMKDDVKKRLLRLKGRERDRLAEDRLVDGLLSGVAISLPEEFVEKELEAWAGRKRMTLEVEGVKEEEIAKAIDAAKGDAKVHIEKDLKRFFLLDRVAEAEKVEVTEQEMAQAIQDIAQAYGRPVEEVMTSFRDGGRLAELRSEIRHRKAREAIRRAATLVEEAPAPAAKKAEKAEKVEKPEKKDKKKK
jgi:trigger factor